MTATSNAPKAPGIAAAMRESIRSGEYRPGHQLPSARALAQHYSASRGTVTAAMSMLIREGLVESRPRTGWFAAECGTDLVRSTSNDQRRYVERVAAGAATPAEAESLGIETGKPVLRVARTLIEPDGSEQPQTPLLVGPDRTLVYELPVDFHDDSALSGAPVAGGQKQAI